MTVLAPEFLQTTKYSAQRMRAMMAAASIIQEGIVNFGDFAVSQRGAGANMSVDVAAGDAWILGDNTARQGLYHVGNDGNVNVAVPAAHATNPRIDQVVLRVYDSTVIGGEKDLATIEVISGTATLGASLSNLTGAAALPSTAIRLAYILVGAAVTKVETANLGNVPDPRRGLTGYPAAAAPLAVAGAPPQYAHGRPLGYVPTLELIRAANQAVVNTTNVPILWTTETMDTDAMHVLGSSEVICNTPGTYGIWQSMQWNAVITGGGEIWWTINGVENLWRFVNVNAQRTAGSGVIRLKYGDVVVFNAWQSAGVERQITGRAGMAWQGP